MKYRAFISYRHSENGRRHAVALETALKRYAKPTLARPMPIFRDEKHMKPDISLPKLIREGLENSEYLIFLAERASAESQWCGEELEIWCSKLNRTPNLIIALIDDEIALSGMDGIHWEQTTALPALLRPHLTSIPLYMDLRWAKTTTDTDLQNPKYRHEINSLAARLRGVNPEDLNDEEIRVFRRNIRLRNGAIGVLLAMLLVALGAAWWALQKQKVADELQERDKKGQITLSELQRQEDIDHNRRLKLISAYNFFDEKYALSYEKSKSFTNEAFYFIDKNGDEVQKLGRWVEASQFDDRGLSRVRKIRPFEEDIHQEFYLDTSGVLSKLPDYGFTMDGEKVAFYSPYDRNVRAIDFSAQNIRAIPHQLFEYKDINMLLLDSNKIKILPSWIGNFSSLTMLDLSHNQIAQLPKELGRLATLTYLDLSYNRIKRLPNEIGNLKNLQVLNLCENELSSLPTDLGNLKNLKKLILGFDWRNEFGTVIISKKTKINKMEREKIRQLLPKCQIEF